MLRNLQIKTTGWFDGALKSSDCGFQPLKQNTPARNLILGRGVIVTAYLDDIYSALKPMSLR